MNRKKIIEDKLKILEPSILIITNNSALHANHLGNTSKDGESHFSIEIAAIKLENLSKIEQHKIINNLLKDEFNNGLHALSIKIIPN
jgi:BolA protein